MDEGSEEIVNAIVELRRAVQDLQGLLAQTNDRLTALTEVTEKHLKDVVDAISRQY
ncbi:MAG TPA: hypothetical protein VMQ73_15840 [Methylomirabilota bacterium]|nr:hypothetical protein [Methylomirabilota bacterium]